MKRIVLAVLSSLVLAAMQSPALALDDDQPVVEVPTALTTTADESGSETITLSVNKPKSKENGLTAAGLICQVTMPNPHFSDTSPGVIVKINYSCTGSMSGTLGINGNLYRWAPGEYGPYSPKASTNVNRAVGPLSASTVYVPAKSLPGIYCNMSHWYGGSSWLTLSAGPSSTSGYVESNVVHPQACS